MTKQTLAAKWWLRGAWILIVCGALQIRVHANPAEQLCGAFAAQELAALLGWTGDAGAIESDLESLGQLAEALRSVGLSAEVQQGSPAAVLDLEPPYIVHFQEPAHFGVVVARSIDYSSVAMVDGPPHRLAVYDASSFMQMCSGYVLTVPLGDGELRSPGRWATTLLNVSATAGGAAMAEFEYTGWAGPPPRVLARDCACFEPRVVPTAAGSGAGRVSAVLNPEGPGPRVHYMVVGGQPPRSTRQYLVAVVAGPSLQVRPDRVVRSISVGQAWTATIVLSGIHPTDLLDLTVVDLEGEVAVVSSQAPTSDMPHWETVLRVDGLPLDRAGMLIGATRIQVSGQQGEISIPIRLRVVSEYTLTPSRCVVHARDDSYTQIITISRKDRGQFNIIHFDAGNPDVSVVMAMNPALGEVTLELSAAASGSTYDGELTVRVNNGFDEVISIPYTLVGSLYRYDE